jgi:hypothetical protein
VEDSGRCRRGVRRCGRDRLWARRRGPSRTSFMYSSTGGMTASARSLSR